MIHKISAQEELLQDRFAKVESLEKDKHILNAKEAKVSSMLQEAHDKNTRAKTHKEVVEKKASELSAEWKKLEEKKCKYEDMSKRLEELIQREKQLIVKVRDRDY